MYIIEVLKVALSRSVINICRTEICIYDRTDSYMPQNNSYKSIKIKTTFFT